MSTYHKIKPPNKPHDFDPWSRGTFVCLPFFLKVCANKLPFTELELRNHLVPQKPFFTLSYNLETVSAPGRLGLFGREGLLIEMRGEGAGKSS